MAHEGFRSGRTIWNCRLGGMDSRRLRLKVVDSRFLAPGDRDGIGRNGGRAGAHVLSLNSQIAECAGLGHNDFAGSFPVSWSLWNDDRTRPGRGMDEDLPNAINLRDLSLSIAPKREVSTVNLTVNVPRPDKKSSSFRCLQVPETIEWE